MTRVDVGPRFYNPCQLGGFSTFSLTLDLATLFGSPGVVDGVSNVQCPMLLPLMGNEFIAIASQQTLWITRATEDFGS